MANGLFFITLHHPGSGRLGSERVLYAEATNIVSITTETSTDRDYTLVNLGAGGVHRVAETVEEIFEKLQEGLVSTFVDGLFSTEIDFSGGKR